QEVGPGKVAAKPQRRRLEIEVNAEDVAIRAVPVRDAQRAIAFLRVAAERWRAGQTARANGIGRALGVQRRRHAVLAEIVTAVQPADAGAADPDARRAQCHVCARSSLESRGISLPIS